MSMRVAFAGDWHANHAWAVRAIRHAADQGAERIVHLGDFGYHYTTRYVAGVDRALRDTGLELWFIDGNHENFPRLNRYPIGDHGRRQLTERLHHLPRGYRWTWDGVRFLALGGAHSVDRPWRVTGTSWWPDELITDQDVEAAIAGGPVDVLVSHDCPSDVEIPGIDENDWIPPLELLRAAEHRRQVDRVFTAVTPHTVWHGHYHVAYSQLLWQPHGPVWVHGLDCDGTMLARNITVITVGENADEPQASTMDEEAA